VKLVVGLGNPGEAYARTRHNVGFRCVGRFARLQGIHIDRQQCRARVGIGNIDGDEVVVAKPRTFMNASGESVHLLVKKFEISLHDLLVVHDDIDLPLGKIRLRQGGGSGGHKGMDSIIACLGSQDFPRIRIGIGRPEGEEEEETVAHVLGAFSAQESKIIDETIPKVVEALRCFLIEGIEAAMNKYN
jgi:PTH1 family peptidyl-tRNA hydrolase